MPMIIILARKKIRRILDAKLHNSYSRVTITILRALIAQAFLVMLVFVYQVIFVIYTSREYKTYDEFNEAFKAHKGTFIMYTVYEGLISTQVFGAYFLVIL